MDNWMDIGELKFIQQNHISDFILQKEGLSPYMSKLLYICYNLYGNF